MVASGNCNAQTGVGDPYLPFREVLELLCGEVESRWAAGALTREHARRLWNTLPLTARALVEHGPDLIETFLPGAALAKRAAAGANNGTGWLNPLRELLERRGVLSEGRGPDQSRIFQEYLAVLQALATRQPLLLFLDDLHWADLSSVSLLSTVARP